MSSPQLVLALGAILGLLFGPLAHDRSPWTLTQIGNAPALLTAAQDVQTLTTLVNTLARPFDWTCRRRVTASTWAWPATNPTADVLTHTPDLSLAYLPASGTLQLLMTVGDQQWRATCPAVGGPQRATWLRGTANPSATG